jgi:hypothetical protein
MAAMLVGAAALGVVMGTVLGAAQATALHGAVHHPWRWISASATGWAVAMTIIFAGATSAGATWSWPVVVGYGALTVALGGTALGVVSAPWLDTFEGHSCGTGWCSAGWWPATGPPWTA